MTATARLTRRDETVVELLVGAGLSKNLAKTLVCMSKRSETTSVEIEKATGLRQPEVSIAMQELRSRKWVEKRDIKKEGKGRPVHAYHLALPFSEIADTLARDARKQIEVIEENLKRLKQYT